MFLQKLSSFLFAATTTLTLGTALLAQGGGLAGSLGTVLGPTSGAIYVAPTPPTLPPYESRTSSFDRSIGNSWLGGSVHAYASMARQKSGSYELGFATVEMNGIARVLQQSREVFDVVATCMNVRNNTAQTRSGYLRIEMLGATVIDQSVAATTGFGSQTYTFNLLPGGVSASVPVGPVSVTLNANAGCGASRSASLQLPAGVATAGMNASASMHAFANASVSFGIPGFNVGVGVQGKILEQTLNANMSASAVWGLSGGVTYTLKAITLQLYAWATALYTWTTNLCSWSTGQVSITLI